MGMNLHINPLPSAHTLVQLAMSASAPALPPKPPDPAVPTEPPFPGVAFDPPLPAVAPEPPAPAIVTDPVEPAVLAEPPEPPVFVSRPPAHRCTPGVLPPQAHSICIPGTHAPSAS